METEEVDGHPDKLEKIWATAVVDKGAQSREFGLYPLQIYAKSPTTFAVSQKAAWLMTDNTQRRLEMSLNLD